MAKNEKIKNKYKSLEIEIDNNYKYKKLYQEIDSACFDAKNVYNKAMYYARNYYIGSKKKLDGEEISDKLQHEMDYIDESISYINEDILEENNTKFEYNNTITDVVFENSGDINEYYNNIKKYKKELKDFKDKNNIKIKTKTPKNPLIINYKSWGGYILNKSILTELIRREPIFKELSYDAVTYTVDRVVEAWKSYSESMKSYQSDKSKFTGKPKIPYYAKTGDSGRFEYRDRRCCSVKDGYLIFDKRRFKGIKENKEDEKDTNFKFYIGKDCLNEINDNSIKYINAIINKDIAKLIIVYEVSNVKMLEDNGRVIGVDFGIDRLATVCNNIGLQPFAINGRVIKHKNLNFNTLLSKVKSDLQKTNGLDCSFKTKRMYHNRNNYMKTEMHKASRIIVDYCIENNINTIIIGKNKFWKQKSNLVRRVKISASKERKSFIKADKYGFIDTRTFSKIKLKRVITSENSVIKKDVNETFVQIPIAMLIDKIKYKANDVGINVIMQEESYTSMTSFIDNEELISFKKGSKTDKTFEGSRDGRLFISKNGSIIHADVNGAYNIIRKYCKDFTYTNQQLHPYIINM